MPDALYFTDDDDANELIAREPLALLIGFALDQQVTVQTAFTGPLKLEQRLGTLIVESLDQPHPASTHQPRADAVTQPVHVKERQHREISIVARYAPARREGGGVGREVVVRQHGTLRATRGP